MRQQLAKASRRDLRRAFGASAADTIDQHAAAFGDLQARLETLTVSQRSALEQQRALDYHEARLEALERRLAALERQTWRAWAVWCWTLVRRAVLP